MSYTDEQKWSIIDQARKTISRTSKENLDASRLCYAERHGDTTLVFAEPPEDRVEKWKREQTELMKAKDAYQEQLGAERERLSMVHQLHASTIKCQHDIAEGMRAVSAFATTIVDRLDDAFAEIDRLRTKLAIAETRFEDLKRTFDGRNSSEPNGSHEPGSVVDLKPRRA
jgi:hypothetical protein